jgi:glycosyltransferase involved in cell wall biosynthesis
MRILVISDLPAFVTGGAEMQAARLIEAWLDAGHEVRCLGRRMGPGPVRIGKHLLVVDRIWTTSVLGRWGRAVSYFASLAWLLLQHRRWMDVIYTRFLGEAAATASLLKAVGLLQQPLVATPANTRGDGDTNLLRSLPFGRHLVRLLDRNCDAINLIAEDMVEELQDAGFSGVTFSRIPNGIPVKPLPMRAQASAPRLLAVGRLSRQKGYDVLLRALMRVRERLTAGQVEIIGDGPERERLLLLAAELQLMDQVVWRGELSQTEVADRLEQSHVFLLPSRYEGMSNAGLEAMERGLPLILTRCGGLDRHVGPEMGWVVPPEDEEALSGALSAALALDVDALYGMGMRARECVVKAFDMKIVAKRYLALFEALARRSTRDGAAGDA